MIPTSALIPLKFSVPWGAVIFETLCFTPSMYRSALFKVDVLLYTTAM
jgi:hypothetical protein